MMKELQTKIERYAIEEREDWRSFIGTMPFIQFPADWAIQVVPPFAGAIALFRVRLPSGSVKSIYFDAFGALGFFDGPYWEVYPVQGENQRCSAADVTELLRLIADESLGDET